MTENDFCAHQIQISLLKNINGQRASSFRGAKLWNSLEREKKSAASLKIFKENIFHFSFEKFFKKGNPLTKMLVFKGPSN